MKRATELVWLRYFHAEADFGPADDDVRDIIAENFRAETGLELPTGYGDDE